MKRVAAVMQRGALQAAARAAFGEETEQRPWEQQLVRTQQRVRALYLAQARALQASADAQDQTLGRAVERFVREMQAPDTQRLALARALREPNELQRGARDADGDQRPVSPGRSRDR